MILGMAGGLQMLLLLGVIGGILIAVFFNITLQQSMAAVSQKNRSIAPGLIWLNFIPIPLLNSVWTMIFGIVACNAMNKDAGHKIAPSTLAVVYPSISIFNTFLYLVLIDSRGPDEVLAILVTLLSITTFILWIVFWAQLSSAKNKLQAMGVRNTYNDSLDSGSINMRQTQQAYQTHEPVQTAPVDIAPTHVVNVSPSPSPNVSHAPPIDPEPISTSYTQTNQPVEQPQITPVEPVIESISVNVPQSPQKPAPKRISEVELQRAYKQLDLAKGIDQRRVEAKFEQLSAELQSKINSTNTDKLKQIYLDRLNEVEGAFAVLLEHFDSGFADN
jgi:hypothetical protein